MAKQKSPKKQKQLIRIPSRFYVGGSEWKLEYKWNLRLDDMKVNGLCDLETKTIYLDKSLDPMEKKQTFIHELGHAILAEAHLGENGGIDGFAEEVIVAAYAKFFALQMELKFKKAEWTT